MEGRIIGLAARKGETSIRLNARTSTQSSVDGGPVTERARPAKYGRGPNLHDVRFAAHRPGNRGDVAAEGPKGRPKALVCGIGEFDTRLDAAELEVKQALSLHASRSPGAVTVYGLNDEASAGTTAVEIGVGGAGGKSGGALGWIAWEYPRGTGSLHLVVAETAVSQIAIPYRNVRRTRNGGVKLQIGRASCRERV